MNKHRIISAVIGILASFGMSSQGNGATSYLATEQFVRNVVAAESNRTDIAIGNLRQEVLDAGYLTSDSIVAGENVNVSTNAEGKVVISSTGGTTNYTALINKPSINGVVLEGNKTSGDLGLVTEAITNGLASTDWVDNKGFVTASVTNGLATKSWVAEQGYVTTNVLRDAVTNLEDQISKATPANYSVVSNAAMNALSRKEAEKGFMEWVCDPSTNSSGERFRVVKGVPYDDAGEWIRHWYLYAGSDFASEIPLDGDVEPTELVFTDDMSGVFLTTATRTRIPTMADIPTNNVQLVNGASYVTSDGVRDIVTNTVVTIKWEYYNLPQGVTVSRAPYYDRDDQYVMDVVYDGVTYTGLNNDNVDNISYFGFSDIPGIVGFSVGAKSIEVLHNALGLARLEDLPTNNVQLVNGAGYVTAAITNGLATTSWVTEQGYVTAAVTNGLASTNEVVLTPVYGGNGKQFSEWVFSDVRPATGGYSPSLEWGVYNDSQQWLTQLPGMSNKIGIGGTRDQLQISYSQELEGIIFAFTATRTHTDIIGYTLGTQTNKALASTNAIDYTISNTVLTNTIATVAQKPDLTEYVTTNVLRIAVTNLEDQISKATPANYSAVSNAAMTAESGVISITNALQTGFTKWKFSDDVVHFVRGPFTDGDAWFYELDGWNPSTQTFFSKASALLATELSFAPAYDEGIITATRTRLPTMADIPTNNVQLVNGAGYVTAVVTNGLASTNDVMLTSVYGGNGNKYNGRKIVPTEYDGEPVRLFQDGDLWYFAWGEFGTESPTNIVFDGNTPVLVQSEHFTATAILNPLIGYTLGTQTDKVLAPTNLLSSVDFSENNAVLTNTIRKIIESNIRIEGNRLIFSAD